MSVRNFFLVISALMFCVSCSADVPQPVLDEKFTSKYFTDVYFDNIDREENAQEIEAKNLSDKKKEVYQERKPVPEYYNSLIKDRFGMVDEDELGRFYLFLLENKHISFNSYLIPFGRKGENGKPDRVFAYQEKEFHDFSDEAKKLLSPGRGNAQKLLIGKRKFEKITYKNKRSENLYGKKVNVVSVTFQYSIEPTIPPLSAKKMFFEGKAKFYHDPDDGKWKTDSFRTNDKGAKEIIKLISSKKINPYFDRKLKEAKKRNHDLRTKELEENAEIEELIISKEGYTYFEGVKKVTLDDAIYIEHISGDFKALTFGVDGRTNSITDSKSSKKYIWYDPRRTFPWDSKKSYDFFARLRLDRNSKGAKFKVMIYRLKNE